MRIRRKSEQKTSIKHITSHAKVHITDKTRSFKSFKIIGIWMEWVEFPHNKNGSVLNITWYRVRVRFTAMLLRLLSLVTAVSNIIQTNRVRNTIAEKYFHSSPEVLKTFVTNRHFVGFKYVFLLYKCVSINYIYWTLCTNRNLCYKNGFKGTFGRFSQRTFVMNNFWTNKEILWMIWSLLKSWNRCKSEWRWIYTTMTSGSNSTIKLHENPKFVFLHYPTSYCCQFHTNKCPRS